MMLGVKYSTFRFTRTEKNQAKHTDVIDIVDICHYLKLVPCDISVPIQHGCYQRWGTRLRHECGHACLRASVAHEWLWSDGHPIWIWRSCAGQCKCKENREDLWEGWLTSVNWLWPGDNILRHRSGLTLAQVMVCCMTAPGHEPVLIYHQMSSAFVQVMACDLTNNIKKTETMLTKLSDDIWHHWATMS